MKVLIMSDIEGASSVNDWRQISPLFGDGFNDCINAVSSDINAVIRGIRRSNAEVEIEIIDGHGDGGNLRQELIESNGVIIKKDILSLVNGGYSVVFTVGQHACAGTRNGFLSHTGGVDYGICINGKHAGEVANFAWLFGAYDIPVVLVTGDDAVVREASALLPGVKTVTVKNSSSRVDTECLPISETSSMIENEAFCIMQNRES